MKRSRATAFAAIAVLSIVLAACAESGSVATVNGEPIDLEDVRALRHSFLDEVTLNSEAFRQDLTPLIFLEAELQAAEAEFGLSGLDSDERIDEKLADPSPEEQQIFDQVSSNADRTEAVLRVIATQLIVREEVTSALLESDVEFLTDLYENDPKALATVCARHILTLTEEEAAAARQRIVDGEDFAAVADEVSIDTSIEGGMLPCPVPAMTYVEPFGSASATLPIGELSEPIQTQFGWHLVLVDERTEPVSLEALLADPAAYVDATVAAERWAAWLDQAVAEADIEVSSEVGSWFAEGDGILPPS